MARPTHPIKFKDLTPVNLRDMGEFVDQNSWFYFFKSSQGYRYKVTFRTVGEDPRMERMYMMFGGYKSHQEKEGKELYWLNIQQARCIEFLKVIEPYLGETRALAGLMLKTWEATRLGDEGKVEELMGEVKRVMGTFKDARLNK